MKDTVFWPSFMFRSYNAYRLSSSSTSLFHDKLQRSEGVNDQFFVIPLLLLPFQRPSLFSNAQQNVVPSSKVSHFERPFQFVLVLFFWVIFCTIPFHLLKLDEEGWNKNEHPVHSPEHHNSFVNIIAVTIAKYCCYFHRFVKNTHSMISNFRNTLYVWGNGKSTADTLLKLYRMLTTECSFCT